MNQNDAWNRALRRAEHEISYLAKRAIEMYIEVWEKEPALYIFEGPIAKHFWLEPWQVEDCIQIMKEEGLEK